MSPSSQSVNLSEYLNSIPDPRIDRRKQHKLIDILIIGICAVISGANDFVHMAMFGKAKEDWFKARLELPNGIPSHDTFARVFSMVDPQYLEKAFFDWVRALQSSMTQEETGSSNTFKNEEILSFDGKTVRRSHDAINGKSAIHIVSAWATTARLVVGQIKVDEKSNEITAIPELLDLLDVAGCLITIDAMGCQKAIARKIHEKNANYILALKPNHPGFRTDVELFLEHAEADKYQDLVTRTRSTVNKDHGRIETRKFRLIDLPDGIAWRDEKRDWPGLKSIGIVTATRQIGEKVSVDTRLFITSISAAQKGGILRFARGTRSHWGIENSVHWVLDMVFDEDRSRIRKDNAPENMSVIRHIALNLFRQDKTTNESIKGKRLLASWDINYLQKIIGI